VNVRVTSAFFQLGKCDIAAIVVALKIVAEWTICCELSQIVMVVANCPLYDNFQCDNDCDNVTLSKLEET